MDEKIYNWVRGGLRTIGASFPVAASFGQAWNEIENVLLKQRVDDFMAEIARLVEANEQRVDSVAADVLGSAEFSALLESAIRQAISESDEKKRAATAKLFFGVVTVGKGLSRDEKYAALEALDRLSIADLELLGRIVHGSRVRVSTLVLGQYTDPFAQEEQLEGVVGPLAQRLAKLEARALISETVETGAINWIGDKTHWVNRWRFKTYEALPSAKILMRLLEESDAPVEGSSPQKKV